MQRLRTSDLEAVLAFVGEAQALEGDEPFTPELLDRLKSIVPCESISFEEANLVEHVLYAQIWSSEQRIQRSADEEWRLMRASPIGAYRRRTGDFGAVKWSDFFGRSRRVRHDVHPELPLVDMASVWLVPSLVHKVSVIFGSTQRDFTERDRTLMERLRPHFGVLYRNAAVRRRLASAVTALDRDEQSAIVLLGAGAEVEFVSPAARRLLADWFGVRDGRLPAEVEEWLRHEARRADRPRSAPARPFVVKRPGRRLVVDGADPSALLLREEVVPTVPLTPREWDVMRCVAAGKSTQETAGLLFVEPSTVRKHLEHVFGKLGVGSRTAAVAKLRLLSAASSPDEPEPAARPP